MDRQQLVQRTAEFVRQKLSGDATGHDWWHIHRVRVMARRLAREEGADLLVVELAALLHDIADWKFHDGDLEAGPLAASAWLAECGVEHSVIEQVADIIGSLSFKGARVETPMATLEGRVVQDADRLDALGAVGIARAFAYGGSQRREIYDPDTAPVAHTSFDAYRSSASSTVHHFHEKLLLLADRMNTETARRLARGRHDYMQSYLDRFHEEWEGKA